MAVEVHTYLVHVRSLSFLHIEVRVRIMFLFFFFLFLGWVFMREGTREEIYRDDRNS